MNYSNLSGKVDNNIHPLDPVKDNVVVGDIRDPDSMHESSQSSDSSCGKVGPLESLISLIILASFVYLYTIKSVFGFLLPLVLFGATLSMKHEHKTRSVYQWGSVVLASLLGLNIYYRRFS